MDLQAQFEQAVTYEKQGQFQAAEALYQEIITDHPDNYQAHYNIANIYQAQHLYGQSLSHYQQAITINPDYIASYNNMGVVLQRLGKNEEAIQAYKNFLSYEPQQVGVWVNIANLYTRMHDVENVIATCNTILEIAPNHPQTVGILYFHLLLACDFKEAAKWGREFDRMVDQAIEEGDIDSSTVFTHLAHKMDLRRHFEIASAWCKQVQAKIEGYKCDFSFQSPANAQDIIKVGYISSDFRDHPIGHLTQQLYGLHDRTRFKIYAYALLEDDSSVNKHIHANCDIYRSLTHKSDVEAATIINQDEIDILIDLNGCTRSNRNAILAMRPAPIQMHYLGFLGALPADYYDYIITDSTLSPDSDWPFYKEKCLTLPGSFMVTNNLQEVDETNYTRQELGLPEKGFVFCCFNRPYKIDQTYFMIWMELLKAVPDSVLWLAKYNNLQRENLLAFADAHGVETTRLVFFDRQSKATYLKCLQLADLVLDTHIYSGGTTSCDALQMGVPVLTMNGQHVASRTTSSLLHALDMPELITHSPEAYQKLALMLASNPAMFGQIKEKLQRNCQTTSFFDTKHFVKNLEKQLIACYDA